MTWGEALRLVNILRKDTSSQVAVALEGWDYPIDRGTLATLDLFDLTLAANSDRKKGRPKPHAGRPFKVDGSTQQRHGNVGDRSREQVVAILDRFRDGGGAPV